MERVLPAVEELAGRHADRTVFSRFIPLRDAVSAPGMWKRYWRKWESLTLEHIDPTAFPLVPSLAGLAPPARIIDKCVYSPWAEGHFDKLLGSGGFDNLVVKAGETDVCILATVLGAIERGYRTVIPADAICGSAVWPEARLLGSAKHPGLKFHPRQTVVTVRERGSGRRDEDRSSPVRQDFLGRRDIDLLAEPRHVERHRRVVRLVSSPPRS